MEALSKKLTIFEGPDGSGKSSAAQRFAEEAGAKYVHFSSLPRVGRGLGRFYVEAMLPALLGYQDVVFDRCWLSELPYGAAFREGRDRLTSASRRMLERLAMRCGAVVVRCDPGWDQVRANFMSRRHIEMLDNDQQLKTVYDLYAEQPTDLPELVYNYLDRPSPPFDAIESLRMPCHPLSLASAGNWEASIVLVGEEFAERKDADPWYQWPFASFSNEGCSQWLGDRLEGIDVGEHELLWLNADQDLSVIYDLPLATKVIALGNQAAAELYRLKIQAKVVPHPQSWKRFYNKQRYPLLDLL